MAFKTCSRDDCPPDNVKAEFTTKCFACKHMVHLPCIGITARLSQMNSPNVRMICNKCLNETDDLNTSFSIKSTPKTEKMTIKSIMNEVDKLRDVIMANGRKLDANGKKLDAIDSKTETICNRTTLIGAPSTPTFNPKNIPNRNLPNASKKMTPKSSAQSFADVARNNLLQSAKRKRCDTEQKPKFSAPPPKIGTKTAVTGLSVVAKPKHEKKVQFTRAIWVSRLNPATTNEQITEYIVANTPVTESAKFNVHKLVKKDRDVSTLRFVSFKIEANEAEFDILIEPDVWPEEVMVREFLMNKTLGDFIFPALNTQKNRKKSVGSEDLMDISNEKSPKRPSPLKQQSPPTQAPVNNAPKSPPKQGK